MTTNGHVDSLFVSTLLRSTTLADKRTFWAFSFYICPGFKHELSQLHTLLSINDHHQPESLWLTLFPFQYMTILDWRFSIPVRYGTGIMLSDLRHFSIFSCSTHQSIPCFDQRYMLILDRCCFKMSLFTWKLKMFFVSLAHMAWPWPSFLNNHWIKAKF